MYNMNEILIKEFENMSSQKWNQSQLSQHIAEIIKCFNFQTHSWYTGAEKNYFETDKMNITYYHNGNILSEISVFGVGVFILNSNGDFGYKHKLLEV